MDYDDHDLLDAADIARDRAKEGICSECGEQCREEPIDVGIGPYEYWGYKSVHRDIRYLSPCCEADVVDEVPEDGDAEEQPK